MPEANTKLTLSKPIDKNGLDELMTYDPANVAEKLRSEAPPGTERVVDPIRRKLIQVVPLTEEKMKYALQEILEDDRLEQYAVKLVFPTETTWQLTLGTKRVMRDDNDKEFTGGRQEIGGNRMIPIEEFQRSVYTLVSRYDSVKRNAGKKYGGQGIVNNRHNDAA